MMSKNPAKNRLRRLGAPGSLLHPLGPVLALSSGLLLCAAPQSAGALTLVVDQSGAGNYRTIAAAIGAAVAGDRILVNPGTYKENIAFAGKAIEIVATQGPELTILDGSLAQLPAVTFNLSEGADSILEGFTITQGRGFTFSGATYGGGVYVTNATPTLRRLVIRANSATWGGGIGCRLNGSPTLEDVQILSNYAASGGGGLYANNSDPNLIRVIVADNATTSSGSDGGGLWLSKADGVFENLLLLQNTAVRAGGGLWTDGGAVTVGFSTIVGNNAVDAGGIYAGATAPYPSIHSSIVALNGSGGGVNLKSVSVGLDYSDLYGNAPADYAVGSSRPPGQGNLSTDPAFARYSADGNWLNDDFHLLPASPLIGAADPAFQDPDGSSPDIGFYGGPEADVVVVQTDTDGDGMPDTYEEASGLDPFQDDSEQDLDSDGLSNLDEYLQQTDPQDPDSDNDAVGDGQEVTSGQDPLDATDNLPVAVFAKIAVAKVDAPVTLDASSSTDPNDDPLTYTWTLEASPPGASSVAIADPHAPVTTVTPSTAGEYRVKLEVSDGKATVSVSQTFSAGVESSGYDVPANYATIQQAIDAAPDGTTISVGPGTYTETLDFQGKRLAVVSTGGPGATTLKAPSGSAAALFQSGESVQTRLEGFTITGGTGYRISASSYGGALYIDNASPTIKGCVLTGNTASYGGAIYVGGAEAAPELVLNRIETNTASTQGGGIYAIEASPRLINNWILENKVTVTNGKGGGIYLQTSGAILENNLLAGNESGSTGFGGGLLADLGSSPTLYNNTFAYNKSGSNQGGGAIDLRESGGVFVNNILAFSSAGWGFYNRSEETVVFLYNLSFGNTAGNYDDNGITDLSTTTGSVSADPLFLAFSDDKDYSNDAFLLQEGSPAIDAGDPAVQDPDSSRSDLGAFGGPGADTETLFLDSDQDGLPDWFESTYGLNSSADDAQADPDSDTLTNLEELALGTDPTRADTDADGVSDGEELLLGSNPTDPSDHQPVAVISADVETLPGTPISLNGAKSYDPDKGALSFAWKLLSAPPGSAITQSSLEGAATSRITFTPDKAGTYRVQLVVNDGTAVSPPDEGSVRALEVLKVPSDFDTIQAAIDAAKDATRIEVSAGTYAEAISFKGKAIQVVAVDPTRPTTLEAPRTGGSVVSFTQNEGPESVLKGFTLTAGTGTLRGPSRFGGGVYINNASPTLLELTISSNKAAYGAGVSCQGSGAPILRRLSITSNSAETAGGAVYSEGCALDLQASALENNAVTGSSAGGGALALTSGASGRIENSFFLGNTSAGAGGAFWISGAHPTLQNNTLVANSSPLASHITSIDSAAVIVNNLFTYGTSSAGEALVVDNEILPEVRYNLFFQNANGATGGSLVNVIGQNGNQEADPKFVKFSNDGRYTNDDFHLATGSPGIDTGDPGLTDLDGTRSDLGAYGGPGLDYTDADGDGFTGDEGDCNNQDPSIYPGAADPGDGVDNNCDGQIDEDVIECRDAQRLLRAARATPSAPTPKPETPTPDPCTTESPTPVLETPTPSSSDDQDGDGYPSRRDCDDTNPNVNPGMDEDYDNGIDDNCDGYIDEDPPTPAPTPTPEEPTPTARPEPTPTATAQPEVSPTATPAEEVTPGCACSSQQSTPLPAGAWALLLLGLRGMVRRRAPQTGSSPHP